MQRRSTFVILPNSNTSVEALDYSQWIVGFQEIGGGVENHLQLLGGLYKLEALNHLRVKEFVIQGASQDNEITRIRGLVGWFKCLKKAIVVLKKKHASCMEKAKNVKLGRGGMYTFLYGGRVNIDTFYHYKDYKDY